MCILDTVSVDVMVTGIKCVCVFVRSKFRDVRQAVTYADDRVASLIADEFKSLVQLHSLLIVTKCT